MYKILKGTKIRVSDPGLKLTDHVLQKDFMCPRAMKVDPRQDGEMEFNPRGGRESRFVKELDHAGYMVIQTSRARWPFIVVYRTRMRIRSRMGKSWSWNDMADARRRL